MAEVFSDDLNLKIGDLLLNPLYHATRKPRARLSMLMHVCARASPKLRASLTSAPVVASDLFSNPLSYISKVARQSGREASAGGHHGVPRRAKRRSHPDSPGSGADPTLCLVAAQMTAIKRISDALFPRGFEVASPRRSLEQPRKPCWRYFERKTVKCVAPGLKARDRAFIARPGGGAQQQQQKFAAAAAAAAARQGKRDKYR